MKWIKNIWKQIQTSDNQPLLAKNTKLLNDIRKLASEYNSLDKEYTNLKLSYNILDKENKNLKEKLPKSYDIDSDCLSNHFKSVRQKYKFKNKRDYLHLSLNNFSKDQEYLDKYLAFLLENGMKESYKDEDAIVYSVTKLVTKYMDDGDNYDTDIESFGKKEWWLTPQESFDYVVEQGDEDDCDGVSHFLWGCIFTALKYFGYEHYVWRLLRFDMSEPFGHAILIWLNRRGNWKRIESTYNPNSIKITWNKDTDIFRGEYVKIMHIFNETGEYRLK